MMADDNQIKDVDVTATGAETVEPIHVTDKRRVRLDEDGAVATAPAEEPDNKADAVNEVINPLVELLIRLQEAETKREEAERQARDFGVRFQSAQAQLRAENDEVRARLQRNFEQRLESARGDIVASLLEVLDNLQLAVGAAEAVEHKSPDFKSLLDGVRATAMIFAGKLSGMGLAPVPAQGELFNPEIHEAVEMVSVSADQDGLVVGEMQTGYKIGARLLRPARVRVGRGSGSQGT